MGDRVEWIEHMGEIMLFQGDRKGQGAGCCCQEKRYPQQPHRDSGRVWPGAAGRRPGDAVPEARPAHRQERRGGQGLADQPGGRVARRSSTKLDVGGGRSRPSTPRYRQASRVFASLH
jgi:hypothetical protein